MGECEYGIVANVAGRDRIFRRGARVWIASGTGGEGWFRFVWFGHARGGGRKIEKWAPTHRFHHFRAAWVPEQIRGRVLYFRGSREEMEQLAPQLEKLAASWRSARDAGVSDSAFEASLAAKS